MSLAIYLITFGVCTFNLYLTTKIRIKVRKHYLLLDVISFFVKYVFAFYPIVLLYGFRYRVGVDYSTYLQFFKYIQTTKKIPFFSSYMEPGYVFLNYVASKIFTEGYGIFFVNGIVVFFLIYLVIRQYSQINKPLSVYIFLMVYFGFSCNGIRQMIAALILLLAYYFLLEQKMKSYVVVVLIATLFHSSAIFFLVFLLLERMNVKYYKYLKGATIFLGVLIILFPTQIMRLISVIGKYEGYIYVNGIGSIRGLAFLAYVIPILLFIECFKADLIKLNSRYELYVLLIYLQIPLQCFGIFNTVIERMALYCSILQIVVVPLIVNGIQIKKKQYVAKAICYAWYLLYFVVMEIFLGGNGIATYQFWIS